MILHAAGEGNATVEFPTLICQNMIGRIQLWASPIICRVFLTYHNQITKRMAEQRGICEVVAWIEDKHAEQIWQEPDAVLWQLFCTYCNSTCIGCCEGAYHGSKHTDKSATDLMQSIAWFVVLKIQNAKKSGWEGYNAELSKSGTWMAGRDGWSGKLRDPGKPLFLWLATD